MVKAIEAAFNETTEARKNYQINRSMMAGRQWITWDNRSQLVRDIAPVQDRYRVTANRLWASSRSLMASALRRPLQFQVLPERADAASARASRLAESVVRARRDERDWEDLRADVTWAAWLGGTAGLSLDWDPEGDRPLGMTEDGRKYATGDTIESALTILDFAVQPGAKHAERAEWWVRQEALPPKTAKERYGLSEDPPTNAGSASISHSYDTTHANRAELTTVYTLYERPCGDFDGAVSVIIDGKVVDSGDWSFPFRDRLNLAVVRETIVPGRWFGDTVFSAAVPLQTALNAALTALIDHTRRAGNARMRIPQSVVDMIDELTDEAGQVLPWPDGAEGPEWISPPQLPSYVIDTPQRLAEQIDDILSQHDVSRGEAPGRVDSGLGLSILSENDATPLAFVVTQIARAFGELSSMLLATYATKIKDKRTQRVYGAGQPAEQVAWVGRDLLNHTHAEVPPDALVPKSRAASNKLAMDMWQAGILTDPMQALRLIEFPDVDDAIQALDPHIAKARREIHRIRAGHQQIPDEYDGPTHVMEHMLDKLSESYELSTPEQQELCHKHLEAHRKTYERLGIPWPQPPGMPEAQVPQSPAPAAAPGALQAPLMPMAPPPVVAQPEVPMDQGLTEADLAAQILLGQGIL